MRWTPGDRGNIEDMRGQSGGGMRMGGIGLGGLLLVLVLSWATGVDFLSLVGSDGVAPPSASVGTSGRVTATPGEERMVDMRSTAHYRRGVAGRLLEEFLTETLQ